MNFETSQQEGYSIQIRDEEEQGSKVGRLRNPMSMERQVPNRLLMLHLSTISVNDPDNVHMRLGLDFKSPLMSCDFFHSNSVFTKSHFPH